MRVLLLLFLSILLAGCAALTGGTDNSPKPVPVAKIRNDVKFNTKWVQRVGRIKERLYLNLTPVVYNNQVFFASSKGKIMAFDVNSGKRQWRKSYKFEFSSPVDATDNTVLVGTIKGLVIQTHANSGKLMWDKQVSTSVLGTPVSYGGTIYVQADDGGVFALSAKRGAQLWSADNKTPTLTLRGSSTPLPLDNKVMIATADGKVIAYNRLDGTQLWSYTVATPAGNNVIERLVDINSQMLHDKDTLYAIAYNGKIAAIDIATGAKKWDRTLSAFRNFTQDANNLYIVDANSKVWALDKTSGSVMWINEELLYHHLTAPVVINNNVLVGDKLGTLYSLNAGNGHLNAENRYDKVVGITALTKASDDSLLILLGSGKLICTKVS
jgi:outer membrane protein assembly factor BamB